jgi:hypothetical protein
MPFKMPEQMLAFYHTERDSRGVLTLEPLFNALKLTVEWIRSSGASA